MYELSRPTQSIETTSHGSQCALSCWCHAAMDVIQSASSSAGCYLHDCSLSCKLSWTTWPESSRAISALWPSVHLVFALDRGTASLGRQIHYHGEQLVICAMLARHAFASKIGSDNFVWRFAIVGQKRALAVTLSLCC